MVKAKKKKAKKHVTITHKQAEDMKMEITKSVLGKINLLYLTVLADEYKFTDEQLCEVMETVTRWSTYVDDKIVRLNEVADIIEKKTGMRITRW